MGVKLATDVYALTADFPHSEKFGLTMQMRRAAVSVPSNIAEGSGRSTDKSFHQFISVALGSLNELETQLVIADRLGLCTNRVVHSQVIENIAQLGKMLTKLMQRLQSQASNTVSDTELSYMLSYSSTDAVSTKPHVKASYHDLNYASIAQPPQYSRDNRC